MCENAEFIGSGGRDFDSPTKQKLTRRRRRHP